VNTAKIIALLVGIVLVIALVVRVGNPSPEPIVSELPTPLVVLVTPPLPTPSPSLTPTPTPWALLAPAGKGFRLSYPSTLFDRGDLAPTDLSLASAPITMFARLLGPRGYFAVGTIARTYSATTIGEAEQVRDITPVTVAFGSGVHYTVGEGQCTSTVYRFPLTTTNETLRIAWTGCTDHPHRLDQDTALHMRILNTLQRIP
jgi:hypothetical protein